MKKFYGSFCLRMFSVSYAAFLRSAGYSLLKGTYLGSVGT